MTPEFWGEFAACAVIFAGFLVVLGVGGLIADYVFPHIPPLQRWLDSLPEWDDEEDYEEGQR